MTAGDLLLAAIPIVPLRTGDVPNGLAVKWHGLLLDQLVQRPGERHVLKIGDRVDWPAREHTAYG